ncbi:DUF5780 domain-containing protein [Turicibacter sanguinis]|uniref:DUF5780 domain-containing protein n=2 Tax=Turicibacter sanguinis TaxID=154288 RepID=UPI0011C9891C|nr:DUF5780 domain-containing protein [Turicibacter sanguinis]MDB8543767.1 DUF5780 domain-containing protein [Turicibacter sanguinis]MTK90639.1 hypothetical protein [Turicibacter sanguinis]MTK99221.1 hypothetical protein [Turicibacter sanguinis]MTN64507.1 hypothetical protein [Turicibacter sanguinis]
MKRIGGLFLNIFTMINGWGSAIKCSTRIPNFNFKNIIFEKNRPDLEETTLVQSSFDNLLMQLPVTIIKTKHIVRDKQCKHLYPDMLQAVIKNKTSVKIKDVVVAFVAWDKDNSPVKIKESIDFGDGAYIKTVNYTDINLIPGGIFKGQRGLEIDESCEINTFKSIVLSYTNYKEETWINPQFEKFCSLYEGKQLN